MHSASELPGDQDPGKSLAGFRGKGVDVAIVLDAVSMHRNSVRINRSAADVLLAPRDIPVE